MYIASINKSIGCWEYNMKLAVVKRHIQILLVPNYCAFQITVSYVTLDANVVQWK